MDDIVWLIVATAIIVALAGIVLYMGSGALDNFQGDSGDIKNNTLEGWDSPINAEPGERQLRPVEQDFKVSRPEAEKGF
ncbi:MAG: hypothetical protein ACLFTA_03560 [Candidatus Nanohaloarchaea archaeon]